MVTVRTLVERNDDFFNQVGTAHWKMIRDQDEIVTTRERTIAYIVQTALFGLNLAIHAGVCLFIASRAEVFRKACMISAPLGVMVGISHFFKNAEPLIEQEDTDLYACYKLSYKVSEALKDVGIHAIFATFFTFMLTREMTSVKLVGGVLGGSLLSYGITRYTMTLIKDLFKSIYPT